MDSDLKRAVDINYKDTWNELTVEGAITAVRNIVNMISNPAVHRIEFDNMEQNSNDSIKEFITCLKVCSADCNFVCPFNEHHDLTEYHLINRIRSGFANKALQQELLQKYATLNTLNDITQFCENFEAAKNDNEKLCANDPMISSLEKDDIVAAISNYRKLKNGGEPEKGPKNKPNKCYFYGLDYHPKQNCPAQSKICNKWKGKNHFAQACCPVSMKEKGISSVVIGIINRIINVSETKESGELPTLDVGVTNADNASPKPRGSC